ncbi:carboxypeptidase S [[Candida] jaroonii]|uniref:Carboxypeptidase S n=1 Tax=[Candida] jaroonii TaxID=467808 RepID=A0ACA9Y9A5_9ASCO|nr:carboxypeptidase S [[Candida] jaroonii]
MRGLITDEKSISTKKSSLLKHVVALAAVVSVAYLTFNNWPYDVRTAQYDDKACPMHPIRAPESFVKDNTTALNILYDEDFRLGSVKKLSGAVQIDTQVFDDPPQVDDKPEYWKKFAKFHEYLEKTFPTVYDKLEVVKVNTYGLVFIWKGSDESLKPVMLCAHQDVVPIQKDTLDDWSYPPLEGHYDGEKVFGRGSSDCKNVLIAILESLELLIAKDYKPERGIIAALGFDEEVSGKKGALEISKYLEERFGQDSIYSILDEGTGISKEPNTGLIVAGPAVAEKGYVTINAKLKTKGGHASIPPDHTSIGIASELVYLLEENPFKPVLSTKNPTLEYLQCLAKYGGDAFPPSLARDILRAGYDKVSNSKVIQFLLNLPSPLFRYLIQTSQAVDIIRGGEKENALPEFTEIFVNHRIAVESSVKEVVDRFVEITKIVAKKHNLAVNLDGESVVGQEGTVGVFNIGVVDTTLEPSPVAPTTDKVWEYLAGASRHLVEDLIYPGLETPVIMAPSLMPANTDTRHYHKICGNVFRYTPALDPELLHNAHSVDEYIPVASHLHLVAFFYEYLQIVNTKDAGN